MRNVFVRLLAVFVVVVLAFSMNASERRRPVRAGSVEPTYLTRETSLSVWGPNAEGKYKVPFVAWFPVPEGATITPYYLKSNGEKVSIPEATITVTAENANRGWAAQIWGGFTGGAANPSDSGIVSFRVEFTGNFQAYSVNTKVPDGSRSAKLVDVYPNGKLFLKGAYSTLPVASLNGRGHPIVNGWITPMDSSFTGPGVVVTVCSGFPDSECQTEVVDIPSVTQSNLMTSFSVE